jgi:hypothetical protein
MTRMDASRQPMRLAGRKLESSRHVCAFFNSRDEEYRVLLPFVKEGAERNERGFHIVDARLYDDHLQRLAAAGIDVEAAMRRDQLEVRGWEEAYLREGRFDQNAMLSLIEDVLQGGRRKGFPLTRLVAHMEWALEDRPGVDDLVEYEARLNYILPNYDDGVV